MTVAIYKFKGKARKVKTTGMADIEGHLTNKGKAWKGSFNPYKLSVT